MVEVLREGYHIPFLSPPPLTPVHNPLSTKGVALEEVTLSLITKCGGTCSTSISGLLQPSVCGMEDLGVVASSHRPLHPQSLRGCVALSDGDHPVCSPFHPSGRLDSLHRSSGGAPSGSGSSGVSSLPPLCLQWSRLPIQSSVLWPIHGSAGLLSGHGSCFRHSPLDGYPHAQVPRRLACPVFLSGVSSQGSPGSPESLPRAGHCDQPREVQPCAISGCPVSRGGDQCVVFCGFSVARSHIQAAINCRRISILRLASRKCLAVSAGDAFLAGSPGPRGQTAHVVSATVPPPVDSCGLVRGVSSGSPVVASPASPLTRCVSPPGVSRPRLLVRHLGRRVGCSSGSPRRFRPLGLGRGVSPHQRQGAANHPARSSPFSVVSVQKDGRSLLRQRHCGGVSTQGRGNQVSLAEFHCAGDPALVGVARHPSGSEIHPGLQQRPSGRSVSPSPASAFRVVPQHDRFSIFELSVASSNRFVCHLSKSPLFDIFLSLPRPSVSGHGRLPPVPGRSAVLCPNSRNLGGWSSPLWLRIGLSAFGFRTSSSCRWPLRWSSPTVQTSCSCLCLRSATRVSTGYGFMPGETPAVHQSRGFLVSSSGAGFLGAPFIFVRQLPAQVDSLQIVVSFSWSFGVSSFPCEGGRFSVLVAVCQRS